MATQTTLTVSQLNKQAKNVLEGLPNVSVQGEISNFSAPGSGHWYFTLKDAKAQVRCAMFRGRNLLARTTIKNGDSVVVNANISLYEGRGDYQLIVQGIKKAGLGDLHEQFEALKAKLAAEGLFDSSDKRPLPSYPQRIGIISSPTGAAVHDMLTVLKRRYPSAEVIIYPAVVQGADAPISLRKALAIANVQDRCDVLIIGRGGGSIEDLWAFNNEHLAREVWSSGIPIISAVGHEVDVTLCDFVADLRAPTPSAAAEAATPDSAAIARNLAAYQNVLAQSLQQRIKNAGLSLRYAQARLVSPQSYVQQQRQRLDYSTLRLQNACRQALNVRRQALINAKNGLHGCNPRQTLDDAIRASHALQTRLKQALHSKLAGCRIQLQQTSSLLNAVSPLQTLNRGYSITQSSAGKVIATAGALKANQAVRIQFSDGIADAIITQKPPSADLDNPSK